jgi:hypothetical protein
VNGFPEADPDIQQAQAAAQTPEESAGNYGAQIGPPEKELIVCPFRPPGQNQEQNSHRRTEKHQQQHSQAMEP